MLFRRSEYSRERLAPAARWSVSLCVLVSVAVLLLLPTFALGLDVLERTVFSSQLRGGALVVGNPDYSSTYAVALWARSWSTDPPYGTTVYCSCTNDGGVSWSSPTVLYKDACGTGASPGRGDFARVSADAVMDEHGLVHLVMVFGRWYQGPPTVFDPSSKVVYGQVDCEGGQFLNEETLGSKTLNAGIGPYASPAICLGRQVPGRTSRYIHVAFANDLYIGYNSGEILYTRSTDSGVTWTTPVDINWFSGFDTANPPDICADSNGNVYVAYGPDWYTSSQPGAIYFRSSANDGATWDGNNTVIPGTGGGPSLLCDDSNNVYIFYNFESASAERTDSCTAFRKSTNNGTSWGSLVSVSPRYCGGHTASPRVPVAWADASTFHVIISDKVSASDPDYETFYVKMQTDGTVVTPRTLLSLDPTECNNWDFGRSLVAWDADNILVGCCQRFLWDWGLVAFGEPYTMAVNLGAPMIATQRAVMSSHLRGGAMVVGNKEYDTNYSVAVWARTWAQDPPYGTTVYCACTNDGGVTWGRPAVLYEHPCGSGASPGRGDFPVFSADAVMDEDGIVHIVMVFGRWYEGPPTVFDPFSEVVYGQVNCPGGELLNEHTFASKTLDAGIGPYARPAISLGREVGGRTSRYIHVAFANDLFIGYDSGEILYTRSADNGVTWTSPVDINWFSGFDTASPPDICADSNGNVYVAYGPDWYTSSQPGAIYFRSSANDGATWDSNNTAIPGTGGGPTVHCDDSNNVYLFYNFESASAERTDSCTAFRKSTNNGANWGALVSVSPRYCGGHTSSPRIPVDWASPTSFHVIVSDKTAGGQDDPYETYYVRFKTDGTIGEARALASIIGTDCNHWDFGRSVVTWSPELLVAGCCQRFLWDWGDVAMGAPYTLVTVPATPVQGSLYAVATESGTVQLRWVSDSLSGINGFDVLRATSPDGPFVRLNEEMIPPQSPSGYEDTTVWPETEFWYELRALLADGTEDVVYGSPVTVRTGGTLAARLDQPSPNPFRGSTVIQFDVPSHVGPVRLAVYNASGQLVAALIDGPVERGRYSLSWDGNDSAGRPASSGVYFIRLEVQGRALTRKAVVIR